MEQPSGVELVERHTIYACVVGSRAHGTAGPRSDIDRRGIFAAPTPLFWGLTTPPSHVDGPGEERVSWELGHYCALALQANPTMLECLWSPIVERIDETGRELVGLRRAFLSRRAAGTYGGYARAQLGRLVAAHARTGEVRWKQAAHLLRLLLAGVHVLRSGEVLVDVGEHRPELLAVRLGQVTFDQVLARAAELRETLVRAEESTRVPVDPDRDAVEDFLFRTRRAGAA